MQTREVFACSHRFHDLSTVVFVFARDILLHIQVLRVEFPVHSHRNSPQRSSLKPTHLSIGIGLGFEVGGGAGVTPMIALTAAKTSTRPLPHWLFGMS